MFGVALAALGMLGTMTMALTIDAYGPSTTIIIFLDIVYVIYIYIYIYLY